MAGFLGNLRNVVIAGFVLAVLLFVLYFEVQGYDGPTFELFLLRWLHIGSGVMWIGLLWYFNFVAAPTMPKIPDELKPALGRYITPAALFWFRYAALATVVLRHHPGAAQSANYTDCRTIRWISAWARQRLYRWCRNTTADRHRHVAGTDHGVQCLGLDLAQPAKGAQYRRQICRPGARRQKAAAGKTAGMFSRINTLAVYPHAVHCMVAAGIVCIASLDIRAWEPPERSGRLFFWNNGQRSCRPALPPSVRAADPDRYFSALFAPAPLRPLLLSLYAFNHEGARVAESVREPMLGAIRLEWWRETVEGAANGTPRNHDVARGLAALFATGRVSLGDFETLIAARSFRCTPPIISPISPRWKIISTRSAEP